MWISRAQEREVEAGPSSKEAQALKKTVVVLALLALPLLALAQKPVTKKETRTITAVIEAINQEARTVSLIDKQGNFETLQAGPEVRRFSELKVGDKVTFRYTESVVLKVRKPGEPAAASASEEPVVVHGTGAKPGGTMTQQETATVVIKAIDMKIPAVSVETQEGRNRNFILEDKSLLKNLKPGDRVEITFTSALAISVE
jgi:Cu/Ag efflux protein CusF